jgi:hypothetical protein
MRCVGVMLAVVGLVMGPATMAAAPDAASDVGTESQRLDVPEAGVAISLPAAWNAYVEMSEKEDWGLSDEGFAEEPVPFWNVIYASDGGRPWCDLTWYPEHPLTLEAHAERYEAMMTPSHSEVERPIEVASVELPAGQARRFDIFNEPSSSYTTVYLLGAGEARYILECVDDEPAADGWLAVAESLELTDGTDEPLTGQEP